MRFTGMRALALLARPALSPNQEMPADALAMAAISPNSMTVRRTFIVSFVISTPLSRYAEHEIERASRRLDTPSLQDNY
jgi:hypothetical protein